MEALRVTQGLLDARVTLQRLDDARLIRGWIVRVHSAYLSVRTTEEPIQIGERFAARTARLNGDVAFVAELREAMPHSATQNLQEAARSQRAILLDFLERVYVFEVIGEMVPMPSSGDPRYICEPTRITVGGAEAELRDVSPLGLGVVSLSPMPAGSVVPVVAEVGGKMVTVNAEVRYCRRVSTLPPLFRVGLRVLADGRLEKARWMSVVKQRSAQGYRARNLDKINLPVEPMPIPTPDETGIRWNVTAKTQPKVIRSKPEAEPEVELWEGHSSIV